MGLQLGKVGSHVGGIAWETISLSYTPAKVARDLADNFQNLYKIEFGVVSGSFNNSAQKCK